VRKRQKKGEDPLRGLVREQRNPSHTSKPIGSLAFDLGESTCSILASKDGAGGQRNVVKKHGGKKIASQEGNASTREALGSIRCQGGKLTAPNSGGIRTMTQTPIMQKDCTSWGAGDGGGSLG